MGMRSRKYQHPLWCRGPGWCQCRGHSGRRSSLPSFQTQLPHRSQLKQLILEATFDPGWYQRKPPHPPMHGYFLHTWGKLSDHVSTSTTQMSSQALSMRSQPHWCREEVLGGMSPYLRDLQGSLLWLGHCHELAWVLLYTCTVVLWLSTGVLWWSSIDSLDIKLWNKDSQRASGQLE